mmetsp:Transcript_7861/g.18843  ORF Transcript_7861/g.18843 Transcript_7861/m.18843 type:complete len:282 (+) Transcript_7861:74-919(+)
MKRAKVAGFAFEDNLSPSQEETSNSRSSLHCFYPPFLDNSSWAVVRRAFRNHLRLDEKRAEETLYDEERPVLELRTREPESFHVLPEDRRIYPDFECDGAPVLPPLVRALLELRACLGGEPELGILREDLGEALPHPLDVLRVEARVQGNVLGRGIKHAAADPVLVPVERFGVPDHVPNNAVGSKRVGSKVARVQQLLPNRDGAHVFGRLKPARFALFLVHRSDLVIDVVQQLLSIFSAEFLFCVKATLILLSDAAYQRVENEAGIHPFKVLAGTNGSAES